MIKRWFEALTSRVSRGRPEPVARQDRRRDPRFEDGQHTRLQPATTLVGRSSDVEILDGNLKGLRIASREPLPKGSRHWITVNFQGMAARFLLDIRWTRAIEGRFQSGATLLPVDRASELHAVSYYHHIQRLCRQRGGAII